MDSAINDSTDHSTFSNTSGNPDDSGDKMIVDEPLSIDEPVNSDQPSQDNEKRQPPSLEIPDPNPVPSSPAVLIPSMRGTMTYAGGSIVCKGKWAMSDASHSIPGQTSDFEFKLVKKDENCTSIFPVDGLYQGWFMLKQQLPAKGSIKVEDKEMALRFEIVDDNTHKITGQGSNKYGSFNLHGTLSSLGAVHVFREYYQLHPVVSSTPTAKKSTGRPDGIQRRPSISAEPTSVVETPREGFGRIRKQSSVMKEYQESAQQLKPNPAKISSGDSVASEPISSSGNAPSLQRQTSQERTHRLTPALRKCSDLLKELSKLHQARWFLEAVDPVKLNIPEYLTIIKNPMDFSTIREKVESGEYEGIHQFADDMRLVFRNAITFNSDKSNIVHINAKEVASKFEDRFRTIVAQLEDRSVLTSASSLSEPKLQRSTSTTSISQSKGKEANKKRPPLSSTPRTSSTSAASGPRQPPNVPPAAVDPNAAQILELQKQLAAMKEEVERLRAALAEKEAASAIEEKKAVAQGPLSYDEKRQLVSLVHKLPPEKIESLVAIIREGLPPEKKDDEITEVPLEILDTATLRRLQKFVKENVPAQKKRAANPGTRTKSEPSLKRTKKSASSENLTTSTAPPEHADIDLFEQHELLMENDNFNLPDPLIESGTSDEIAATVEPPVVSAVESHPSEFSAVDREDGNEWEALG